MKKGQYCYAKYSKEMCDWIKDNYKGKSNIQLAKELSKKFNIETNNRNLRSLKTRIKNREGFVFEYVPNEGRFEKGITSWNKGTKGVMKANKTSYKKGNETWNTLRVGTEKIDGDGYVYVKIGDPNKWKAKHRIIWEEHYGKIPKGYKLIFLDNNKLNVTLENLAIVSDSEEIGLNKRGFRFKQKHLTETGLMIVRTRAKALEKERKMINESVSKMELYNSRIR